MGAWTAPAPTSGCCLAVAPRPGSPPLPCTLPAAAPRCHASTSACTTHPPPRLHRCLCLPRPSAGVLYPFTSKEDCDFFQHLEMHMRQEHPPLLGRDHLAYRWGGGGLHGVWWCVWGGAQWGSARTSLAPVPAPARRAAPCAPQPRHPPCHGLRDHHCRHHHHHHHHHRTPPLRSFYFPVKDVVDGDLCEQYPQLAADKARGVAEELDRSPGEVLKKLEDIRNKLV